MKMSLAETNRFTRRKPINDKRKTQEAFSRGHEISPRDVLRPWWNNLYAARGARDLTFFMATGSLSGDGTRVEKSRKLALGRVSVYPRKVRVYSRLESTTLSWPFTTLPSRGLVLFPDEKAKGEKGRLPPIYSHWEPFFARALSLGDKNSTAEDRTFLDSTDERYHAGCFSRLERETFHAETISQRNSCNIVQTTRANDWKERLKKFREHASDDGSRNLLRIVQIPFLSLLRCDCCFKLALAPNLSFFSSQANVFAFNWRDQRSRIFINLREIFMFEDVRRKKQSTS